VYFSEEGLPYYYHMESEETTWEEPYEVSLAILSAEELGRWQTDGPLEASRRPNVWPLGGGAAGGGGGGGGAAGERAAVSAPHAQQQVGSDEVGSLVAQLGALKVGELRRRALTAGVDEALVEEALDQPAPKQALIELVIERGAHVYSQLLLEQQQHGGAGGPALPDGERPRSCEPPPRPRLMPRILTPKWAATCLQARHRGNLGRTRVRALVEARAAVVLQCLLRRSACVQYLARLLEAQVLREQGAASRLQAVQRGRVARSEARLRLRRRRAVVRLQRTQRGRLTRQLYRQWKREYDAARRLQAWWRGAATRRALAEARLRGAAATRMQKVWRGWKIRQEMAWWERQRVRERVKRGVPPAVAARGDRGGIGRPHAFSQRWSELPAEQRRGAERMGFTAETWDEEYFLRAPGRTEGDGIPAAMAVALAAGVPPGRSSRWGGAASRRSQSTHIEETAGVLRSSGAAGAAAHLDGGAGADGSAARPWNPSRMDLDEMLVVYARVVDPRPAPGSIGYRYDIPIYIACELLSECGVLHF
jgi:hypothetical protein